MHNYNFYKHRFVVKLEKAETAKREKEKTEKKKETLKDF
jgi:hypothetical protein